jgi:hypothetical protein
MVDPRNYDYQLVAGAPAVDSGVDFEIKPILEYVHPLQWRDRESVLQIDVGAHERCGLDLDARPFGAYADTSNNLTDNLLALPRDPREFMCHPRFSSP